jgi:hypothetical protein
MVEGASPRSRDVETNESRSRVSARERSPVKTARRDSGRQEMNCFTVTA